MVKSNLLVFMSLSVAVHSFLINYSTPQQCGDVEISWANPFTTAAQLQFPLLLHVLPFNSAAISQQIPGWNASMTSGSAVVTLNLSLKSGTRFLLAVTDQTDKGVGRVSDVKSVAISQDASCLSTNVPSSPCHFETFTTLSPSDCPSLYVTWDSSVKSPRPTILGFSPGESPVNMDPPSSPLPAERSVFIKGTFTSMSRVVVLFQDNNSSDPSRTSQFLTVGGMDQDGCSTLPSNSSIGASVPSSSTTTTTPSCDLQCSNKNAGRVVGGVLAGIFCFAIALFAIFAYCRRRYRAAHRPPSDSADVSLSKSIALSTPPSPPCKTTIPNGSRPVSHSIAPTSTKFEIPSDKNGRQQCQESENESNTPTTPSSIAFSHSFPLSLPASPLTRRRSWASRSMPSISTDESIFLQLTEASIYRPWLTNETGGGAPPTMHGSEGGPVSRPDSPTLPESKSRHTSAAAVATATPPPPAPRPLKPTRSHSHRSERSEQRERREAYMKLDTASEITVLAGGVYSSRGTSSWTSRMSRKAQ